VEFLERCATISSEQYMQTLKKLKQWIWRLLLNRKMNQVLLLHDNNKPHTSLHTRVATATVGWNVLPHPPYGPDLAPSDFHLFGPLKDVLWGHRFVEGKLNIAWVESYEASAECCMQAAYGVWCKSGKSVLIMKQISCKLISIL